METLRTLLVDDNRAFLTLAKALLAEYCPRIEVIGMAADGLEAVRFTEQHRPDLIVMDLFMPKMGGSQAARLIKAQDHPPIILIASHFDDAQHREHCAEVGADGFVSKQDYEQKVAEFVANLIPGPIHV